MKPKSKWRYYIPQYRDKHGRYHRIYPKTGQGRTVRGWFGPHGSRVNKRHFVKLSRHSVGGVGKDVHRSLMYIDSTDVIRVMDKILIKEVRNSGKTIALPVAMYGAELMEGYIKALQKEPKYRMTKKGTRASKRKGYEFDPKKHARPIPGTGYAWWSGTLRRAIVSRKIRAGKALAVAGVGVDRRKGQAPKWAGKRNAYDHARYIHTGEQGRKKRPIFRTAYNQRRELVAKNMKIVLWGKLIPVFMQHGSRQLSALRRSAMGGQNPFRRVASGRSFTRTAGKPGSGVRLG